MPFTDPIIGGSGVLVRSSIRSPDYVPGGAGWTINRDGTAEFNNVTVRGSFATGAAGGPNPYLTIDDATDRTTISFWNAAGTKRAFINSPAGATAPQLGHNTGIYDITPGTPGYGRLFLAEGQIVLEQVRESDQTPYGGTISLTGTSARLQHVPLGGADTGGEVFVSATSVILARNIAGVGTGGQLVISDLASRLFYVAAGVEQDGITCDVNGVHSVGSFPSDIGWSFAGAAGWTVDSFRLDRWGPFVALHIQVTRTGANIAAGGGNVSVGVITSAGNVPLSQTSLAAQWPGGIAAAFADSAGQVSIRALTAILATNEVLRLDMTYFRSL